MRTDVAECWVTLVGYALLPFGSASCSIPIAAGDTAAVIGANVLNAIGCNRTACKIPPHPQESQRSALADDERQRLLATIGRLTIELEEARRR